MENRKTIVLENHYGYSPQKIEELLSHLNTVKLPEFVSCIDALTLSYLANTPVITGKELTGLYYLFALNRTLATIDGQP